MGIRAARLSIWMYNVCVMEADPFKPIVKAIRDVLETEKSRVLEELRNYPQPAAACDLHYQDLFEQRDAIARELTRLDVVSDQDRADAIEAFIAASKYISGDAEKKFLAALKGARSTLKRSPV